MVMGSRVGMEVKPGVIRRTLRNIHNATAPGAIIERGVVKPGTLSQYDKLPTDRVSKGMKVIRRSVFASSG